MCDIWAGDWGEGEDTYLTSTRRNQSTSRVKFSMKYDHKKRIPSKFKERLGCRQGKAQALQRQSREMESLLDLNEDLSLTGSVVVIVKWNLRYIESTYRLIQLNFSYWLLHSLEFFLLFILLKFESFALLAESININFCNSIELARFSAVNSLRSLDRIIIYLSAVLCWARRRAMIIKVEQNWTK